MAIRSTMGRESGARFRAARVLPARASEGEILDAFIRLQDGMGNGQILLSRWKDGRVFISRWECFYGCTCEYCMSLQQDQN